MSYKIRRLADEISQLKLDELKELEERLGSLGAEPLGIHAKLTPKINPPTLSDSMKVEIENEL